MKNDKKETEKKWKKFEHAQMKEQSHQLEMKEGYDQDESYEKSED